MDSQLEDLRKEVLGRRLRTPPTTLYYGLTFNVDDYDSKAGIGEALNKKRQGPFFDPAFTNLV